MSTFSLLKVPATLIAAVIAVASLAPALHAQDSGFIAKVNVPFAFQSATGQHFTAGVYTIRMDRAETLLIQGKSASGLAITQLANDGRPGKTSKAVFTRYGDRYFLREVWITGNSSHLVCNKSKAERRSQVAVNRAPNYVQLALLDPAR